VISGSTAVLVILVSSATAGVGASELAVAGDPAALVVSREVTGALVISGAPSVAGVSWYVDPVSAMIPPRYGVGSSGRPCGNSSSLRLARLRRRLGGVHK
jgi:hypothetical protein